MICQMGLMWSRLNKMMEAFIHGHVRLPAVSLELSRAQEKRLPIHSRSTTEPHLCLAMNRAPDTKPCPPGTHH